MLSLVRATALVALVIPSISQAETVTLDVAPKTQLQMQVPDGLCPLQAARDTDKAVLGFFQRSLRGEAKLLAYFIDCQAYADLGTDSYEPHSWMLVLAPLDNGGNTVSMAGETREAVLDAIARRGRENKAEFSGTALAYPEQEETDAPTAVSAENRGLGVVDKDSNAVYQGLLSRVTSSQGTGNVAGMINSTFVAGHLININAYAAYDAPTSVEELIQFSKAVTRDFIEQNEPPPQR